MGAALYELCGSTIDFMAVEREDDRRLAAAMLS